MARPLRIEYEGAVYHVTSRGNERKNIFFTRRDYEKFSEYLYEGKKKFHFVLHCYVLMPNHYHLLIETPKKNLHSIMHYLNSSYSTYTNVKRKRSGHLLQGRYKSIVVDKDNYLLELSRYIHLNPVRAKIVNKPEDYSYSSYQAYISDQAEQIISKSNILGHFDGRVLTAQERYKMFVEIGLNEDLENPLRNAYGGGILGDEDFVNEVLTKVDKVQVQSRDITHRKAFSSSIHADVILNMVCEYFCLTEDEVIRKGNEARSVYVYFVKNYTDTNNQKISEVLKLSSYSSVSKIYGKFVRELEVDDECKVRLKAIEEAFSLFKV